MGNSASAAHGDRTLSDSGDEFPFPMPRYYTPHDYHSRPCAPRYKLADNKIVRKKFFSEDFSSIQSNSPTTIPTLFRWSKGGQSIHLMGSFDGWSSRIPLVLSEDEFIAIVELPVGRHEYKFLVDGVWSFDPDEPRVDNGLHSYNNVVTIKETDFEVFKALAEDDKKSAESKALSDEGFGQDVPQNAVIHQRPPTLPPQLLQIVLNKEAPLSVDPTILHTPQLAELNHLHALSIKGGVITMSSTHRYKKKYITTIFYQPT